MVGCLKKYPSATVTVVATLYCFLVFFALLGGVIVGKGAGSVLEDSAKSLWVVVGLWCCLVAEIYDVVRLVVSVLGDECCGLCYCFCDGVVLFGAMKEF